MSADKEDMLDTLTPEEREAIAEVDADEQAALERIASGAADPGGDDDDDDAAAGDAGAGGEGGDAAAAAPAPAAAPSPGPADASKAQGPDDGAQPAPAPAPSSAAKQAGAYRADLPNDFAEKKADADRRAGELRAKFKAGEIEVEEYEAQRATIDDERDALRRAEIKAEISREMNEQSLENQWRQAIERQLVEAAKPEHGGIDYSKDADKMGDLDGFVRSLGARPENADKPMDWFLAEAHRRVLALHGITPAAAPAAAPAQDGAAAVAAAVDKRKPPTAAVPPTVAHVPGSDGPGDMGGDEFADLDRLEGVELEAALSRLSPAQREKYAAGA